MRYIAKVSQNCIRFKKINRPFGQEGYTHTKGVAFRNKKLDFFEPYAILRYFCDISHCSSKFCDIFCDTFCDTFYDAYGSTNLTSYYERQRLLYGCNPLARRAGLFLQMLQNLQHVDKFQNFS